MSDIVKHKHLLNGDSPGDIVMDAFLYIIGIARLHC